MIAGLGLAFVAGLLSTLSPCVLPLLPIVLGAAASKHRLGPLALASGLVASFVAIGLFVASVGFSLGLDGEVFRRASAAALLAVGVVLIAPPLQARLAVAGAPISGWAEERFGMRPALGVSGQFGVGLLLGAVWSPCVGPTLGAASLLAARGEDLGWVAVTMLLFGLGASLPLAALGLMSRRTLLAWRGRIAGLGGGLKVALGFVLAATGVAILTGVDHAVETWLVSVSPAWLTALTTSV